MNFPKFGLLMIASCVLVSCGEQPTLAAASAGGGPQKFEKFCSIEDLSPSQRHTFVLVDENLIEKVDDVRESATKNNALRQMILSVAEPTRAITSGVADHRERVSLVILPANGSTGKLVFSGCLPSVSVEERQGLSDRSSATKEFFTGSYEKKISKDVQNYTVRLLGGLYEAARQAPEVQNETGKTLEQSSVFQSLKASGRTINGELGVPRIVLIADVTNMDLGVNGSVSDFRQAGFSAGNEMALDLVQSDLIVMQPNVGDEKTREFFHSFFLAQHANLISWSGDTLGSLPKAPVEVQRFIGEALYPTQSEIIQIRVARDRDGRLVNSWMRLRGFIDRSTPLTGQVVCTQDSICQV